MDGEELAFLITNITSNQQPQMLMAQHKQEEHNVYGIAGIAQIFGCSIPTASRIKKFTSSPPRIILFASRKYGFRGGGPNDEISGSESPDLLCSGLQD